MKAEDEPSPAARLEFVKTGGLAIVLSTVKMFWPDGDHLRVKRDDAIQIAMERLWAVAPDYDPALGTRFTTYLTTYARGSVRDTLRRARREVKLERGLARMMRRLREEFEATLTTHFNTWTPSDEELLAEADKLAERCFADLAAAVEAYDANRSETEEEQLEEREMKIASAVIRQTVQTMEPRLRMIWDEYYLAGKKLVVIARELGLHVNTIRDRKLDFEDAIGVAVKKWVTAMPRRR